MQLEKYDLVSDRHRMAYTFYSEGPRGTIKKSILYQEMRPNVFNLVFGDLNEDDQTINDNVRSNNNDRDKVLATVAATILDFIDHHPTAVVFAKGITPARTRLYQMGIQANWQQISKRFNITGYKNGKLEPFKKGKNYDGFFLNAK